MSFRGDLDEWVKWRLSIHGGVPPDPACAHPNWTDQATSHMPGVIVRVCDVCKLDRLVKAGRE